MTCGVEWCGERAQASATDGNRYCIAHKRWNIERKCKKCARLLLEDYKDSQHPMHSCNTKEDGTFNGKCRECDALHVQSECAQVAASPEGKQFTTCCARGRAAHIPKPNDVPRELQDLLKSAVFCDNIRRYNAASGFISFGDASGSTTAARIPGQGPPVYVVHGQVYHRINVLMPSGNKDPSYGQLYIYDPVEAVDRRANIDLGLSKRF